MAPQRNASASQQSARAPLTGISKPAHRHAAGSGGAAAGGELARSQSHAAGSDPAGSDPVDSRDSTEVARRRALKPNELFVMVVTQPLALKLLVESVSHVLTDINIAVVHDDTFEGLRIETLDDNKVCMVSAKLSCDVTISGPGTVHALCVSAENLLMTLKNINPQYTLTLTQTRDDARLAVHSCDPLTQTDTLTTTMSTKESTAGEPFPLQVLDVAFEIEIKLPELRSVIKHCQDVGADQVQFEICEVSAPQDKAQSMAFDVLTLRARGTRGDTEIERRFRGMEGDDAVSMPVDMDLNLQGSGSPTRVLYCESFSTSYMHKFMRAAQRNLVRIRMAPQKPIHVEFPLGGREAELRYILAPQVVDT